MPQAVVNSPINVLANDSDPDGDPLSVLSVTQASHGTFSVDSERDCVWYTPDPGFSGTDTFTYTVVDGALINTVTVTWTVPGYRVFLPALASFSLGGW